MRVVAAKLAQRPGVSYRTARSLRRANTVVKASALPEPSDARGAIQVGLSLTDAGDYAAGLKYFEQALELPGTGLKR